MNEKYTEAITLVETLSTYAGYMAKSHNADEFQRNYRKYDEARQRLLVIIKEELYNDSK